MEAKDIYSQWYRAFVFHADWAMGIPDFRELSLEDQVSNWCVKQSAGSSLW